LNLESNWIFFFICPFVKGHSGLGVNKCLGDLGSWLCRGSMGNDLLLSTGNIILNRIMKN